MDKVLVILPAYNEEKSIGQVIDEIRALEKGYDILVVDNNSKDKTAAIAKSKGVQYLFVKEQGKGCAMNRAFEGAGSWDYTCVVMMDADGTYPAAYIPIFLQDLGTKYDAVLGCRWRKEKGSMSLANRFGNKVLTEMANLLFGTDIHDLCSGMWAFCNEWAYALGGTLSSKGFTLEAEMLARLSKWNLRIGEVPIVYRPRVGEAKLHIVDGLRIARCLIRERFR